MASNTARYIVSNPITEGRVRRGYLGIAGRVLKVPLRWMNLHRIDTLGGIVVQQIEPKGPARNSELMPGDIIVELESKSLLRINNLHRLLNETTVGREVMLPVLRRSVMKMIHVIPADMK